MLVVKLQFCNFALTFQTSNKFTYTIQNLLIMALTLTDANFEEIVLKSDKPVLVDFWAEWCGPCRVIGPIVNEIADDYKDRIVVGKLDVDNNPGVSSKYGIRNIPTVLFFKNGEVADKQVGAVPKSNLVNKVEALL